MLAADKLLLQSDVKQRATSLREKELNLFNSNFSAIATQAGAVPYRPRVCAFVRGLPRVCCSGDPMLVSERSEYP